MKQIELTQTLKAILEEWITTATDEEKIAYVRDAIDSAKEEGSMELTDKNKNILAWMQENREKYNNIFTAKQIGDELFMSGRAVSGSVRKLVAAALVAKSGQNPVCYSLTDNGIEIKNY